MRKRLILIAFMFLVPLTFLSCSDDDQVNANEIIELKIFNSNNDEIDSVIGDGTTIIVLEATIPKNASDDIQTITFKTTEGYFFGTTENTIQERVNVEGIAQVSLVVPLSSGNLFLTAEVKSGEKIFSDRKTITLLPVDQIIALNFKTVQGEMLSEIPRADGTTTFQIEANVLVDRNNLKTVNFIASNGKFLQTNANTESKSTNELGVATVSYQVPQSVGPVYFTLKTGSSGQYFTESNLTFERAHADEIFLEPATLNMNSSSGNVMTAFLRRDIGQVSTGTEVDFEAFQVINNEEVTVGRFTGLSEATSNDKGQVTATFYGDTGDIDFQLPVTIRVSTMTDSGDLLIVSDNINISQQ